jgi:hypothetical protein
VLEWVGGVAIAAVVIGALAAVLVSPDSALGRRTGDAVCRVLTIGQGGGCAPVAAAEPASAPAAACSPRPGAAASALPVSAARLRSGDGRTWEKTLTTDGAYRVSLTTASGDADATSSRDGVVTLDAGGAAVSAVRTGEGTLELAAGPSWLARSSAEADALVGAATADQLSESTLAGTPVRSLWDGVRSVFGAGGPVGTPDATLVGTGAVLEAADVATGVSTYSGSGAGSVSGSDTGSTSPLGVRVTGDGQATVYLLTNRLTGGEGDGTSAYTSSPTDTVVAVSVDSTGQPRRVGVTVLSSSAGTATTIDDPRLAEAFGWQDDVAPRSLSATVALDDSSPPGSLTAAADVLSSAGSAQWSLGNDPRDPLSAFSTAARAPGVGGGITARSGDAPTAQPVVGLATGPGGPPLAWDGVWRGDGDLVAFDGRDWTAKGPCG